MIRGPIDGKYVELWGIPAWRRKLGIGDESLTLTQRIEIIVAAGAGSVDNANARLAAFSTLEETGYVVQTALSPPSFAGREIIGTPNQVDVANGNGILGNTTLSLPQDINTGATPEFQTIKPSLLNPEFVTYVNAVGELDSTSVTADAINTIAAGTPGYFPYWLGGTGGLSPTSPIYTDGTFTGVGTIAPDTVLHVAYADVSSTNVTDILKLEHASLVGALGVGAGTGLLFSASSDTVSDRDMGRIQTRWTVATDATRAAAMDFHTATAGGTLSTKMTILQSGFVGIGTTTPLANLHYESSTALATRWTRTPADNTLAAVTGSLDFYNGTFNIAQIQVQAEGVVGSGQILFRLDTTGQPIKDRVIFKGNGYCGFSTVGTTITPAAIVDIHSDTSDEPMFKVYRPGITKGFRILNYNGTVISFRLQTTSDNTNWNEMMAFHVNNGFLGIGEVTPLARIHALVSDAVTNSATVIMRFNHLSSATPVANFGTSLYFTGKSSTTDKQDMGLFKVIWTTATDATRTSAMEWQTVNSAAALATRMALSGAGGLSVGDASNAMPVGVINAVTGYRIGNAAGNQQYLRGDGTNFVSSGLVITDATGILPMANGGTNKGMVASAGAVAFSDVDSLELTAIGVAGQVLTSQGAGTPTWTTPTTLSSPVAIAEGGTNNTTFTTNAVIFFDGVRLTDDGTAFTYGAAGDNQLIIARALGVVQNDDVGYYALNSTPAAAGAGNQRWSPSFQWEGQGWGGSTQAVKFRAYVAPVEAATNPTGYWILERNINALGYIELLRADSTGFLRVTKDAIAAVDTTLAMSVYGLQLNNETAATAVTTRQDPPLLTFKGAAWNSTASTSQDWRFRIHQKGVTVAGTTRSYIRIDSGMNAAAFANPIIITSHGGLAVGALWDDTPNGVVNAQAGFRIANGATLGHALIGNGTNFVSQALTSAAVAYSFTAGSVIFAGPGGTSLAQDNANLFYDDTANALRIGTTADISNNRFLVSTAIARTTATACVNINGADTSSTNNISKAALSVACSGNWSGTGSATTSAITTTNSSTNAGVGYGVFATTTAGDETISLYGIAGGAGSTGIGVRGSATGAAVTNYGGYFSASGATTNYALYCAGGKIKNASSDSIICSSAALAVGATAGFLYIPTCAGTPTGVPAAETGTAALIFDTTNDILYIYRGGWKGVVVA